MTSSDASPPASPATPDAQAYRLHTPMSIIPDVGSVRVVSSPRPFMINGIKVWSSAPIHIDGVKEKYQVNIAPEDGLGKDHYDVTSFGHHLRSTPEIASFARELYYARNTFILQTHHWSFTGQPHQRNEHYIAYPPRAVNVFIRSIVVKVSFLRMDLAHVRRLADGEFGFENLRQIIVLIESLHSRLTPQDEPMIAEGRRNPVRFGCEGRFEVSEYDPNDNEKQEQNLLEIQEHMKPVFIHGCNKTKRSVVATQEAQRK
ncbi:hypothetical protein CC86DRAFT_383438 [Ophiobolus disseminans]|uniref:Uncharacterized protein n=1 Tax=Ophiobolus disseminans TaxID=1469910 RepID=A0A6A6ZVX2_9PLEO|nr:hypothetical protein CC86DRAFT_383438 [Ophiobolus disseminans]